MAQASLQWFQVSRNELLSHTVPTAQVEAIPNDCGHQMTETVAPVMGHLKTRWKHDIDQRGQEIDYFFYTYDLIHDHPEPSQNFLWNLPTQNLP